MQLSGWKLWPSRHYCKKKPTINVERDWFLPVCGFGIPTIWKQTHHQKFHFANIYVTCESEKEFLVGLSLLLNSHFTANFILLRLCLSSRLPVMHNFRVLSICGWTVNVHIIHQWFVLNANILLNVSVCHLNLRYFDSPKQIPFFTENRWIHTT